MGNVGSPYREKSAPCELCGVEVAENGLVRIALLAMCHRCGKGELDAGLSAWGMEETHRMWVEPKSMDNSENHNLSVEVRRPTEIDLHATMSEENFTDKVKAFFGRGDPKLGEKDFDDLVKVDVEQAFEPMLMVLLEHDGVRMAIGDLVAMGCTVDVGNHAVSSNIRNWILRELPPLDGVLLATVALAVHVERFSRAQRGGGVR